MKGEDIAAAANKPGSVARANCVVVAPSLDPVMPILLLSATPRATTMATPSDSEDWTLLRSRQSFWSA
jgi:hypothetical protein